MDKPNIQISNSPEETFRVGERLGQILEGGEVILLTGNLGAGKTLLTKGILSGLDYDVDEVTSPSFALVNLYETTQFRVYHIDLWRVEGGEAGVFALGLDELFNDPDPIIIVEWAERLGNFFFNKPKIRVKIYGSGDEPRTIEVTKAPRSVSV